jgi:hypothetical protein
MKPRLTAVAALVLLTLPAATGCATYHAHHSSQHAAVVPVCANVQHGVTGDYVQRGHRPCLLPSPTAHHYPSRTETPTHTSPGAAGAGSATTTAKAATTADPRLSTTPAPVNKLVKPPPAAAKPASKAAPKSTKSPRHR